MGVATLSPNSIVGRLNSTYSQMKNFTSTSTFSAAIAAKDTYRQVADIFLLLIIIIGFVGNGSAVHILYSCKSIRRSPYFTLLVNQSLADVATCVTTAVWLITNRTVRKTHMSGFQDWLICSLVHNQYPVAATVAVSSYNLAAISLERMASVLFAIEHRNHWNPRLARWVAASTWAIGCGVMLVVACFINGIRDNGRCHFWSNFPSKDAARGYAVFFFFFYNGFPTMIMLTSYAAIYHKVSSSSSATAPIVATSGGGGGAAGGGGATKSADTSPGNAKQTMAIVKVMATCVLAYVLCHGGRAFMSVAARFDTSGRFPMTGPFYVLTLVVMQANSAVNPLIYMLQYSQYRKELNKQIAKGLAFLGIRIAMNPNSSQASSQNSQTNNSV